MRSAPDGQRATCAITSSEGAPSGSIQGFFAVSKTAARPLTHLPEWWQTSASKLTVTLLPTYDLRLTACSSLPHQITNLAVRSSGHAPEHPAQKVLRHSPNQADIRAILISFQSGDSDEDHTYDQTLYVPEGRSNLRLH